MSLKQRLVRDIEEGGPISVADYVWRCLFDPLDGYYSTCPNLGQEGDFITAPMISQMFGEMVGLWVFATWHSLGQPAQYYLIEIGGGDGTLCSDIKRVLHKFSDCLEATSLVLVDTSKPLQSLQREKIGEALFVNTLSEIPTDAPVIILANEVLDCLPARQFICEVEGFVERCIGLDDQKNLTFGLVPAGKNFIPPFEVSKHQLIEISTAQTGFTQRLSAKLKEATGAALLIDYGHDGPAIGDTLQALYRHKKCDPLENPGTHDLTQWADFLSVQRSARLEGIFTSDLLTQREFLINMGIEARFKALCEQNPNQSQTLQGQLNRLIHPDEMGNLFKALCLYYPDSFSPVGFAQ